MNVIKAVGYQGFAGRSKNLPCFFNRLRLCLFFRQINEAGIKQRKNGTPENFCPELSTETVDSFLLAQPRASVQRGDRIDASEADLRDERKTTHRP